MTQKKKAELQRKLSMAPVAKPPEGLLDRLKADIPAELMSTERDRRRLSSSLSFTMRVAASIILLVTSVFLSMQIFNREERVLQPTMESAARGNSAKAVAAPQAPLAARKPAEPMAEVTVALAEPMPVADAAADSVAETKRRDAAPVRSGRPPAAFVDEQKQKKDERDEGAVVGGALAGVMTEAEVAPPPAAPAPPPPPAVAESNAVTAQAPVRKQAQMTTPAGMKMVNGAADASVAAPRTLFGISLDPREFARVRDLIESGEKPPAANVNIDALVNHFAGPAQPHRRDVQLQIEGSRAPLTGESDVAILRYTIDTKGEGTAVGTNAVLDIDLNEKVIQSYRIVSNGAALRTTEPLLLNGVSATGLIEVTLKPQISPRATVATIRLSYRATKSGRQVVFSDPVQASELRRSWLQASTRHRLATLGAVWGASLKGTPSADEVARTAEELAKKAPGDERARDLAAAASAASRLQSSGPTGSGR